ncbi:MAG: transporter [Burkholderiales bacterium]
MRNSDPAAGFARFLLFLILAAGTGAARAQDIEPRSFSNAPVGVNFVIAGYAHTTGSLPASSLPISNSNINTDSAVVVYARVIELWGQSAKLSAIVPYTWLSGSAQFAGQPIEREVNGLADPIFRLSTNLYGAPALSVKEFAQYQQDLIVGANLTVVAPMGQYDSTKLVNIGNNVWSFTPQVGASKALGQWTLELSASATFYTDNNDFFNGKKKSQDVLYGGQGHVIYGFKNGIWGSLDATWFSGGRSTVNGVLNNDLQQNWRLGGTVAFPVDRNNSIKLYASSGVSARTGNNYDLIGIGWQYRWGGGL